MSRHETLHKIITEGLPAMQEEITDLRAKLADTKQANRVARDECAQMEQRAERAERLLSHLESWRDQQGYVYDLTNPEAQVQPIIDKLEQSEPNCWVRRPGTLSEDDTGLTWKARFADCDAQRIAAEHERDEAKQKRDYYRKVSETQMDLRDETERQLAGARAALELASHDERLQSSGQDDYVLCRVRAALSALQPAEPKGGGL